MSSGQKAKLAKALKNNSAITTGRNKNESNGSHELMLTKTQIGKIKKALGNKTGVDVKISKMQIRKSVKHGGSLWLSLLSMETKLWLLAAKAVPALATRALLGLANVGVEKMFGKGQIGGFLILQNKVNRLIQYRDWLTATQKNEIMEALENHDQIIIKPRKQQSGGF